MTSAAILLLTVVAVICIVWAVIATLRAQDGRATALGVIALACYAVAQLLRMMPT